MIDSTDVKILSILQEKARIPNAEIARQVGMAPSAVLERIRKLEQQGLVTGYEVRLDPTRLGLGMTVFIQVRFDATLGDPGPALAALPQALEVHLVAGIDGYLVKLRVADPAQLAVVLQEQVQPLAGVRDTQTHIALNCLKETFRLPLEALNTGNI